MENKTFVLKYYSDMNDSPVPELLRQASIKNENQLMDFSDLSCQEYPDTDRSTVTYIIFYQGGTLDHDTHVTRPFAQ